jgi:hypothetical protein
MVEARSLLLLYQAFKDADVVSIRSFDSEGPVEVAITEKRAVERD